MVSIFSAAKRLCETSGWSLTHLEIQKMAYLAHMFYMGQRGEPLIIGRFEAWAYGPVHPVLYHALKRHGSSVIGPESLSQWESVPDGHPGAPYLDAAVEQLPRNNLVGITHWEHGAWNKNYRPLVRSIEIPNRDVLEEYEKRQDAARQR